MHLERWVSERVDIRWDLAIEEELVAFIKEQKVKSVVTSDRIVGCPHEEGKDYPEGETCPSCPFWEKRDRWTGELLNDRN